MTSCGTPVSDLPLLEQAAGWFDRLRADGLGDQERLQFESWRSADPAHALAFAEVEAAHGTAAALADSNEMLALRHETLSRLVMKQPATRRRGAIAAGFAAVLALGLGWVTWPSGQGSTPPAELAANSPGVYETAVGDRLSARLDDGSTIILNTGSRVRVAYGAAERRLVLEKGQALFEVAKGRKRPFIVQAGDQIVTAHGTAFDVRLEGPTANPGARVKVALIEGSVTVANRAQPRARPTPLRPNEILVAAGAQMRVSYFAEAEQVTSWRDGLVIFEDESLAEAVAEMNRYVRQPIVLGDEKVGAVRISGAFRTGESQAFVEALQMSFPVRVAQHSPERIVLVARP
ncbi:FecR family protein [Sphingosinicella rhizophila]|uniref:FecR domain-containing protein n=1 Tax=Sphingosinicella rhizophila TaxID=3050082 RepID=A0ABU3QB79_9SPHN|nr:FecR domain-containing protein [Sphingosinicella sp. GR2756]MDT9600663.1 FecR domain-containing protein [Sphingosinicella sp. GR2756]